MLLFVILGLETLLVGSYRKCQRIDPETGIRCKHTVASPYDIHCPLHLE